MCSSPSIGASYRRRASWERALLALAVMALGWLLAVPAAAGQQCLGQSTSHARERSAPVVRADDWEAWMCASDRAAHELPIGAVPMCLPEGASAVAPRPIYQVDGARAEAIRHCPERDGAEKWTGGSPDKPIQPPPPAPHDGVLSWPPAPAPATAPPIVLSRPLPGPGPAGVKSSVYRPPRP